MHAHSRHDDTDGSRLERAAESSVAKAGARIVTPVLLMFLTALIGWTALRLVSQLDGQGKDIATIKTDLSVVTTRLDAQVIRQVEANSKTNDRQDGEIQTLQSQVSRLEGVVRTP